eukprot:4454343-Pleurochrysis_carterae.AAC.2
MSCRVDTGPQLRFSRAQWAVCVVEAKATVALWPAADATVHLTPQLINWKHRPIVVPQAQAGSSSRNVHRLLN